jgi:hypothetical protein
LLGLGESGDGEEGDKYDAAAGCSWNHGDVPWLGSSRLGHSLIKAAKASSLISSSACGVAVVFRRMVGFLMFADTDCKLNGRWCRGKMNQAVIELEHIPPPKIKRTSDQGALARCFRCDGSTL